MRKTGILFLFALLAIVSRGFAQLSCNNISVTEVVPSTSLSPCNTVNFVYTITNNSTSDAYGGGSATIHLPMGIHFSSLNSSSSSGGVSTTSASGSSDPVFVLPAIAANGGALTVSVNALVPCEPGAGNTTSMEMSNILVSGNCNYSFTNSFSLLSSSLTVADFNNSTLNLNVGDIKEHVYQLGNPGTGMISSISVNCSPDASTTLVGYCVSTSTISCVSTTPISGSVINITGADMQPLLGTPGLGNGQDLYLHIKYKVSSCNNNGIGTYTFSWGCGPGNCLPIVMNTDINSIPGTPVMKVNTLPTLNNSSYCPGGEAMELGFIYKNEGLPLTGSNVPPPGHTKMIDLKLYMWSTVNMGSIDPASFRINGHPTPMPVGTVVTYTPGTPGGADVFEINLGNLDVSVFSNNPAPFGPNTLNDIDGDGKIDDLDGTSSNPNSFTLTFDYTYSSTCMPEFAAYSAKYPGVATQSKFQNQCGNLPVTDPHSQPFSPALSFESQYNYGSSNNGALLNAPPDVEEGVPFSVELCPYASQGWAPANYDFDCPNGYHQFKLILPPGYHVDPSVSTITIPLYDACYNVYSSVNASVTEIAPTSTEPGYLLINHTRFPPVNCISGISTPRVQCFSVPMIFECTSNPLTANFGFDTFTYTYEYVCDDACSSCVDIIASASNSTYHHCLGPCAKPFFTDAHSFSVERSTLGWVNTPGNYDCSALSSATTVSTTSTGVNTAAAYPGDAIHVTLSGGFAGTDGADYQSMFMQMRYLTFPGSVAAHEEIFEQDSHIASTITIAGTQSADGVYPLTYVYTPTPAGNDTLLMNFTLPPALLGSLVPLTSAPITFNADVHLVAKTGPSVSAWDGTFFTHGSHKIESLRAEFGGLAPNPSDPDGHDTILSCDSWGTRFTMLQPHAGFYTDVHHAKISDCGLFPVNFYFLVQGALRSIAEDDFPNEYKPYAAMNDHVEITIPAGYEYAYSTFSILNNAFNPSADNFFNNTFSAPTVAITPSGTAPGAGGSTILTFEGMGSNNCWPLVDVDYWVALPAQYGITVWTKPACDAPASTNFFFNSGFTESIQSYPEYQLSKPSTYLPADFEVIHTNPVLTLTAPPTVNAFTNMVNFDFQLCNSSTHNAPYGWVTFENPSNTLTLTGVTLLPNASLPVIPYGNGILVNVGSIAPSTCISLRLSAIVNPGGCVTGNDPVHDEVLVTWGNECTEAMPANTETLCQQGNTVFNFNRYPSALNLLTPQGLPSAAVSPCGGTITYTFVISNPSLGTITDPLFWLNLPAGMSLQNASFNYPLGSMNTVTAPAPASGFGVGGIGSGWDLNDLFAALATNGLTGGNTNPNNQVGVTLTVQLSCDYDPNTTVNFYTGGTSSCSQQLSPPPVQHSPTLEATTCCNPCTANAGADVTICAGNNTTLNGTGNGTFLWMPGGSTLANPVVSPTVTTTYILTVTNGSETCTDEVTVFVNTGNIGLTATEYTLCAGRSTTLTASGSTSYTWTSNPGPNPSLTTGILNVTPTVTTTYVVSGTGSNGCPGSATVTIVVNPVPAVTVSASPNPACAGQPVQLTANSSLPVGSYTWTASQGPDITSTINTASVTPASTTGYSVSVLSEVGCMGTGSVTVTVNPVSVSISGQDSICKGQTSTTLSAMGSPAGGSYVWTIPPSGTPLATTSNYTAQPGSTTTYMVTYTANGCTATANYTVTVIPNISVTVSALPSVICVPQTSVLTATGSVPGLSYSWSSTPASSIPPVSTVTVSPVTSTVYTVSVMNAIGCRATASVSVTVVPPVVFTVSPTNTVICSGQSSTLSVVNPPAGVTYTWEPAPQSVTAGGLSATVSPTVTTNYVVTGSNGTCEYQQTVTVVVKECNCEGGTNLASVISSNPVSNANYVLNTNTTITGNVIWDNMSVKIGANKTITVASGATLTLTHSHLWACQSMWEGIVVQNGGRIVVTTNSFIEDAKTAITVPTSSVTTGYVADIRTATFNKNHTAIRIQNCTTTVSPYPFRVADAVFTNREITFAVNPPYNSGTPWPLTTTHKTLVASGTLQEHCAVSSNTPGTLKVPYQSAPAQYGITLYNVGYTTPTQIPTYSGITLGMADGILHGMSNATNLYDNVVDGIHAMNANFITLNSVYQYMVTPANPAASDGTGVYASVKGDGKYRAEVKAASGSAGINRFYDNRNGVKTVNYYEMLISNSDLRSTQSAGQSNINGDMGFEVTSTRYRKIDVVSNLLTNVETGIAFLAPNTPSQVGEVHIDNNKIQHNYPGNITNLFPFVNLGIKAETMVNQSQLSAVILSVSTNTLTSVYNGILTQNWYKQASLSIGNTISIVNDPTTLIQTGISHIANRGNNISDNIITGPSSASSTSKWIGIQSRQCSNELVACNNVSNLSRGIEFFGVHTTPVRFMDNTIGHNKYGYVLSTNGTIGTQSGPLATTASDNRWANPWNSSNRETFVIGSNPTASILKVRSGAGLTPAFNGGSPAYSSSTLANVTSPGSLRTCPAASSSFLAGPQTAMMESIVQQTIPYVLWPTETDIINQHLVYRVLKTDPSLMSGSTVLNNFYSTAQTNAIGSLSAIQDDLEHDDMVTAKTKLLAFTPANTIETNYRNTYDIFVKSKTDTVINPTDSTTLADLAYGCPETDGPAVFQARALRSAIYGIHIVYADNCGGSARMQAAGKEESNPVNYLVYPNPAQLEIYIAVTDAEIRSAHIEIMDITGKLLMSSEIDLEQGIGKLKLDAENGVYFITVSDKETNRSFTKKLVIAK